jgi:hypothetical protein
MVEPRGCVEMGCRFLYSVVDGLTGIQYVGCMQEVFGAKVELDAVVQPSGEEYECVNQRFFDCDDGGPEGLRAFDLRDLAQESPGV